MIQNKFQPLKNSAQQIAMTSLKGKDQMGIAGFKVKVTGALLTLKSAQIVSGSDPSCSVLNPFEDTTDPGTVTGIGAAHVPNGVTVIPVILDPDLIF